MARRGTDDGFIVLWNGDKAIRGGLLNCTAETRQAAPVQPDDPRDLPAVARPRRRGRPARAGVRATRRIEINLTMGELRALHRFADHRPLADVIRSTMLELAAEDAALGSVVSGADLLSSR